MPNFFYFDANGQKQGAFTPQQLKSLAAQGVIGPQTPLEADSGHKGTAGQIPGLFPVSAAQPPAPNPHTASPPAVNQTTPPEVSVPVEVPQTGGGKALSSLVCGIMSLLTCGGLFLLPIIGLILGILGLKSSKKGIAIAGVSLNGVGLVLAAFVIMLLPFLQAGREAATRMLCTNNMKQIGMALQDYHGTYRAFPPLYTVDDVGKPQHSWRVLILPFIEQTALYDQIRLDEPWDSDYNRQFHNKMPDLFRCPSNPGMGCTYAAVIGEVFAPAMMKNSLTGRSRWDISNGMINTLAIVEVKEAFNWMDPTADITLIDLMRGINTGGRVGSNHSGGTNVVLQVCDPLPDGTVLMGGHVHFLRNDVSGNALRAGAGITGGEALVP